MGNITAEDIRYLAKQLQFDMSEKEAEETAKDFRVFEKKLEELKQIDTSGVRPMVYPVEKETSFLREDEIQDTLSPEEALRNAKRKKDGYIVLPRVIR